MFNFINVLRLQAAFAVERGGHLPEYLGSTIRGVMGHCFRDLVCSKQNRKCFTCDRQYDCPYVLNYCNTRGEGGAVNPFVLYPHTQGKTEWKPGDVCIFDLTLFGQAALHPDIFIKTLKRMEKKGWGAERLPFRLQRIVDLDSKKLIYACNRTWLDNVGRYTMQIREKNAGMALIVFDTPVRIVSGGDVCTELPFHLFLRFLMGRFALMTQAFTDFVMQWDQEEMLKKAEEITIVEQKWKKIEFTRYSMNQKEGRLELPAQIGWVMYEGDLSGFIPYLEAGQYLHVGKNTTIGFGHYHIFYEGDE